MVTQKQKIRIFGGYLFDKTSFLLLINLPKTTDFVVVYDL